MNISHRDGDAELRFCCQGCLGAYLIIRGAGLEAFYARRQWVEAGVAPGSFEARFSDDALEECVSLQQEHSRMNLLLEGIRCASCVWLIEKIIGALEGIDSIRVNYATHRVQILFDRSHATPASIVESIARLGYLPRPWSARNHHLQAERERRTLLIRFSAAAFLSMQLMGYSAALYAGYFQGIAPQSRQLLQILSAVVATPVIFYCGAPFLQGALRALRLGTPNMDMLISIGVLCAYGYSLYALAVGGEVYFDSASMIVTLVLLGRIFESMARGKASCAVDRLLSLSPQRAKVLEETAGAQPAIRDTPSHQVEAGALIRVYPGEAFPLDALLLRGSTEVDAAVVTGESRPVVKSAGDEILAGAINLGPAVDLQVLRRAEHSYLSRMAALVEDAQSRRAPIQRQADRISAVFVPLVLLLALATGLYWALVQGDTTSAWLCAISVLVVACPCALGLATPTAILVATGAASRRGILFRGGDIVEACSQIKTLAFDKTGTLTEGRPRILAIEAVGIDEIELLRLGGVLESGSSHPLGRAICEEVQRRGLQAPPPAGHLAIAGMGVEIDFEGHPLRGGSRRFLEDSGIVVQNLCGAEQTEVLFASGDRYLGRMLFEDSPRPEASSSLALLRRMGLHCMLLTGDRKDVGERVAQELGIEEVACELSPGEKAKRIQKRQLTGELMMIGDGINDAPALAEARVGCAMAGGTDIALESSDLVFTRPDLMRLPLAIALSRRTLMIIRQNLFWAFSYNLIAMPLAATGQLAPIYSALAMVSSSVLVLGNSLRLNRFKEPL